MPTRSENLFPVYRSPQFYRDSLGVSNQIPGDNIARNFTENPTCFPQFTNIIVSRLVKVGEDWRSWAKVDERQL